MPRKKANAEQFLVEVKLKMSLKNYLKEKIFVNNVENAFTAPAPSM